MSPLFPFPNMPEIVLFGLVLGRIAGIFSAIPLFGAKRVPLNIRIVTIFTMSLVLFPVVRVSTNALPGDMLSLALLILREALIGITLGLLAQALFSATEFCGQLTGIQMGLSIATLFDPTIEAQSSVIATFQGLLAVLLFLASGVHHVFIHAIVDSYSLIPLGAWHMNGNLMTFLISITGGILVLALKLAAPVMVALLASTVALGIMARAFPQMNVFLISMPLNIGLGFLILGMSLLVYLTTLGKTYGGLDSQIKALFRLMA